MSTIDLGFKKAVAALDTTGFNAGNWTNVFTHDVLGATVPSFECYRLVVKNIPTLATVTVYKGNVPFSSALLAGDAEWDPSQPMPLTPQDDAYVTWNIAAAGTPPVVWFYMRYDPAVNPAQF